MADLNKMREQFEAAITAEISAQLMAVHPAITEADAHMMIEAHGWLVRKGDTYESPVPAMGWWAWQKSRSTVVVELPDARDHDWGWIIDRDETREAIEAAGLKVAP